MGRWFGRKSVPDARPFVPAWLHNDAAEEGFARFLTFEMVADEGSPLIGTVLNDASQGAIACTSDRTVGGYAAYGKSMASAVQPLVATFGVELFDDGSVVRGPFSDIAQTIDAEALGNGADNEPAPRVQREQASARALPAALRLSYYEPARDYQIAEARAVASEERGTEEQRDLAAVLSAGEAKALAQELLGRSWAERDTLTLRLPPSQLGLEPGSKIELDLCPRRWMVRQCTVDGLVVIAELKPATGGTAMIAADAGRALVSSDVVVGEVSMALIDPAAIGQPTAEPTVLIAASSATPGWKARPVEVRYGGQRIAAQTARRKAIIGATDNLLPAADPALVDSESSIDVTLVDPDQWLVSCDDQALAEGANLALVGKELIQFGVAESIGTGRFRLSRLSRGRGGTEATVGSHAVGDAFVLIERDALQPIVLPPWALGYEISAVCGEGSAAVTMHGKPIPAAIADPAGGTTADSEARAAITQMLAAMRQEQLIAN